MGPQGENPLVSFDSQENVRKWIETGWKVASAVSLAVGTAAITWMGLKFATKDELQNERDIRAQQNNESTRQIEHLAEQREINIRVQQSISDHENRLRTLEIHTVWNGKALDNRDLGHP